MISIIAQESRKDGQKFQYIIAEECGLHLHPAQEEDEQPPHPDPDEAPEPESDPLPSPKRDRSFSVSPEPHFSQTGFGAVLDTIFSKSALQELQWYS